MIVAHRFHPLFPILHSQGQSPYATGHWPLQQYQILKDVWPCVARRYGVDADETTTGKLGPTGCRYIVAFQVGDSGLHIWYLILVASPRTLDLDRAAEHLPPSKVPKFSLTHLCMHLGHCGSLQDSRQGQRVRHRFPVALPASRHWRRWVPTCGHVLRTFMRSKFLPLRTWYPIRDPYNSLVKVSSRLLLEPWNGVDPTGQEVQYPGRYCLGPWCRPCLSTVSRTSLL